MDNQNQELPWLSELTDLVRAEFIRLQGNQQRQRPALEAEYASLELKKKRWSESLGNPNLPETVRTEIEVEWTKAIDRMREIENLLAENVSREQAIEQLVDPEAILARMERLSEVLGKQNPTQGNLELSLHVDKIVCFPNGSVNMRTCKLGALTDAVGILSSEDAKDCEVSPDAEAESESKHQVTRRRRGRLRVADMDDRQVDVRALADFAADPNRFDGLSEEWFWTDTFQIPELTSWAKENAEAVFIRRQVANASYAKLGEEFGVMAPTARAAVRHYLDEHPEAKDEVNLPRGGQRPPKFDLTKFGHEARALWESGRSKLWLAEKYECSTPTIDKALAWSYEQDGLAMPTRQELKQDKVRQARSTLDQGHTLDDIKDELGVSDVTAWQYLCESFAAEGKPMPDLRRRRS